MSFSARLLALSSALIVAFPALAQTGGEGGGPVQTPGAPGSATGGGAMQLLLMGGMIFFMWLFIIRPQAKRQRELKALVDSLQPGNEVVTSGGLIGKVVSVSDSIITLDLGNGSVRVLKSAVTNRLDAPVADVSAAAVTTK